MPYVQGLRYLADDRHRVPSSSESHGIRKVSHMSLGGVGTGNVLRCRGRAFIVTAKHVADG